MVALLTPQQDKVDTPLPRSLPPPPPSSPLAQHLQSERSMEAVVVGWPLVDPTERARLGL